MRYFLATSDHWSGDESLALCSEAGADFLVTGGVAMGPEVRAWLGRSAEVPEFWTWDDADPFTRLVEIVGGDGSSSYQSWPREWPTYVKSLRQWNEQLGQPRLPLRPTGTEALRLARWQRTVYRELREACRLAVSGFEGIDRSVLQQHIKERIDRAVADEREACAQIADQQLAGIHRLGLGTVQAGIAEQIASRIRARR